MSTRTWAHAIVRQYPPAWRERYEAEVRGLIDDAPIQLRDLGELIRGLFTERARELLTNDENPRRTARLVGLAPLLLGGLFLGIAGLAGYGLRALSGPLSESAETVALGLFVGDCVAIAVLMHHGWKRRTQGYPLTMPPDVAVMVLPLLFVGAMAYAAVASGSEPAPSPSFPAWITWLTRTCQWAWFALFAGNQMSSFFPGQELLQTFAKISFAEGQIRLNETWVAGCRDMISKGVPSPLQDALAQVGKWTVERDSARARLKELGYGARFRETAEHAPKPVQETPA
jgi:hypothetical protein